LPFIFFPCFDPSTSQGGDILYTPEHAQEFAAALVKYYAEVSDPRAMLLTSYNNLQGTVRSND
jgi:hypothetical protein